jgi:uncharacterized phage-associated protein
MSRDVRSIANFVLDLAEARGGSISNLSINKIVYFLHANYLAQFDQPLVSAKIEAWEYGPVFRELYREFKKFGDKPISGRAFRIDPKTGVREMCSHDLSEADSAFLTRIAEDYVAMSVKKLLDLSHVSGGPWDQVWNHSTLARPSMEISDAVIRAWHKQAARH